jgi:hypothetical protein
MKNFVALFALALITGCATVSSSGPRTVVVTVGGLRAAMPVAKAQQLAEAECGKYDKAHARLAGTLSEVQYVYDCVD